ncbi:hypothetical protein EVAR_76518_1 [Eumeta japonica]|uniref:Uncharacterized protein n=1 Tax=Eumeta variegata TaxID=151549 RepID=A0A4C1T7P7_EUMVA|nr:hypothetical protein EVAR_76518_1 [Eumeta japonica]
MAAHCRRRLTRFTDLFDAHVCCFVTMLFIKNTFRKSQTIITSSVLRVLKRPADAPPSTMYDITPNNTALRHLANKVQLAACHAPADFFVLRRAAVGIIARSTATTRATTHLGFWLPNVVERAQSRPVRDEALATICHVVPSPPWLLTSLEYWKINMRHLRDVCDG